MYSEDLKGYQNLRDKDAKLEQVSRDVVMLFLPHEWNKPNAENLQEVYHEMYSSLFRSANFIGFKLKHSVMRFEKGRFIYNCI